MILIEISIMVYRTNVSKVSNEIKSITHAPTFVFIFNNISSNSDYVKLYIFFYTIFKIIIIKKIINLKQITLSTLF